MASMAGADSSQAASLAITGKPRGSKAASVAATSKTESSYLVSLAVTWGNISSWTASLAVTGQTLSSWMASLAVIGQEKSSEVDAVDVTLRQRCTRNLSLCSLCQILYYPVSKFRTTLHWTHHEYFSSQGQSERRDWAIAKEEKIKRFHHLQRGSRWCYC